MNLPELIDKYEVHNDAEGKSPKTILWYTEMLRAFCSYLLSMHEACNLDNFNVDILRKYIIYLRRKPKFEGHPNTPAQSAFLSLHTVQCHIRALKAFSSWLHQEGYTTNNRLSNLKIPKAPEMIIEPLIPKEIQIINACMNKKSYTGIRNHGIFETMLDTGLRSSEVAGIDLGNFNLTDGFAKVMGKGAKERIVPIGKHVSMVLFSYIDTVRPKPTVPGCNNLFLSSRGEPITTNTIKLMFSRLAKASGVTRLTHIFVAILLPLIISLMEVISSA